MAINNWVAVAAGNWSTDANWSAGLYPGNGGSGIEVTFDGASQNNFAVDIATANLTSLNKTGYTGTLTINSATTDIDVAGAVTVAGTIALGAAGGDLYCAGGLTKTTGMAALPSGLTVTMDGTGTLTCNSVSGGTLVINTAGTVTASGAQFWSNFTLTAGTYTAGATYQTIVGDIVRSAGTCTTTGTWEQTGTGALKWTSTSDGQMPASFAGNGTGTITTVSNFNCKAVSGAGTITDGGGTGFLRFIFPVDNFWSF